MSEPGAALSPGISLGVDLEAAQTASAACRWREAWARLLYGTYASGLPPYLRLREWPAFCNNEHAECG